LAIFTSLLLSKNDYKGWVQRISPPRVKKAAEVWEPEGGRGGTCHPNPD